MKRKHTILKAAESLAAAAEPCGADWVWIKHTLMRMLANRASHTRGYGVPWPLPPGVQVHPRDLEPTAELLASLGADTMPDIAGHYEVLLEHDLVDGVPVHNPNPDRRAVGVYYTPPRLAGGAARLSLGAGLAQADQHNPDAGPDAVLSVLALDPACGAGVYLTEAAEWLAGQYVARGGDPDAAAPLVVTSCCYGGDIDPIAVDLARTALWWQTGARVPLTVLARQVVVDNTLAGGEPPAYADRVREAA